jgi:DNA-binding protein H-NS
LTKLSQNREEVWRAVTQSFEEDFVRDPRLATMSVEALVQMRDDIGAVLAQKASQLKKELASLGQDFVEVGRIAVYGRKKSSLAGRKVAPKYRDKKGNVWAGRGATPVWLREAIKGGAKHDDFLIGKSPVKKKKRPKAKRRE